MQPNDVNVFVCLNIVALNILKPGSLGLGVTEIPTVAGVNSIGRLYNALYFTVFSGLQPRPWLFKQRWRPGPDVTVMNGPH